VNTRMLCRNKVEDFERWWTVFSTHAEAHREAGLVLEHVWRSQGDPNDVFFMFEVQDQEKAQAFIEDPAGAEAAAESGVLFAELHFVKSSPGY